MKQLKVSIKVENRHTGELVFCQDPVTSEQVIATLQLFGKANHSVIIDFDEIVLPTTPSVSNS